MNKHISLFLCCIFCLLQFSFAQQNKISTKVTSIGQIEKPTLADQVFELQKLNKELQQQIVEIKTQMAILQTQVNANYKLLDYSFGKLSKTVDNIQQKPVPSTFTVIASPGNLADAFTPPTNTLGGTYYGSVIIDNEDCNGNPNAIVLATLQPSGFGYNLPTGIAVKYDAKISKWKIVINPNITNPYKMGLAKQTSGQYMVAVSEYNPYQINTGDKFNVLVMK